MAYIIKKRIPATIISGFLGSGKTTLLNKILSSDLKLRAAVLVNDFGSINIDSQLITNNNGNMLTLANGCICCSLSDDLMGQINGILEQDNPPECLLIETSGVSDPGRIARILNYRMFRDRVRTDAIINLLDADQFDSHSGEFKELAEWQLKQADIVIINKTDLVSKAKLKTLKQHWLTDGKRFFETSFADVPLSLLLGTDIHSPTISQNNNDHNHDCSAHGCHQDHSDLFESISWQSDMPIQFAYIKEFVDALPPEVYRAKGVFNTGDKNKRVILQMVGNRVNWSEEPIETEMSSLIVLAQRGCVDFEALKQNIDKCGFH